jgi:putative ABC transport system permease protein
MESLRQDLRFALRVLRKSPATTAVAILTLGIAIGATTSIFSVVSALLLKPLPFPAAERLVAVEDVQPSDGERGEGNLSWPEFLDLHAHAPGVTGVAAYTGSTAILTGRGEPLRVVARAVSDGFFDVLAAPPVMGRAFSHEEHLKNGPRAFMATEPFWRQSLGEAPLGTTFVLDGVPHTLVGLVQPSVQTVLAGGQAFFPFEESYTSDNRGAHFFNALGRLAPGVALEKANVDLKVVGKRLADEAKAEHTAVYRPLREKLRGGALPILTLLLGAVGMVLLIAAVNLANVLLARASGRTREFAVRRALGASSWRLARQLLIESAVLGLLGGGLGLLLSLWGRDAALRAWPSSLPDLHEAPLDARVLGFAVAVSLLTGLGIGLLPALQSSRGDLHDDLREGSGATSGKGRVRSALVVAQSALAVLLLVGAGLLVQSFSRLLHQDPGFVSEHAVSMRISLPERKYPTVEKRAQFVSDLLIRLQGLPGVRAAAASNGLPFGDHYSVGDFSVPGRAPLPEKDQPHAEKREVSPAYFTALGIPLLKGRFLQDREPVRAVVVNEALARKIFPGQDPIGQRIDGGMFPSKDTDAVIVGVVGNIKQHDLREAPSMEIDYPIDQLASPYLEVVVRATAEPAALTGGLKAQVQLVDPDLAIARIRTLKEQLELNAGAERLSAQLLTGFSLAALLLAALGIYGVVSYGVTRREREIGVRMALGAAARDVLTMILREGLTLTLLGVGLGAVAALIAARALSGFLYGISASDPLTYAGVAVILTLVATLATLLPARRATRVDPASALRAE